MTQSTGAEAPTEEATADQPEKTVTIQDMLRRWELPAEAAENLQKFMGQDGPWTEEEATELDRRMCSMAEEDRFPGYTGEPVVLVTNGKGGPHGPECQCGDLSAEELKAVEEVMDFLAPALASALGIGRTPAEKRTGVSDPEAAIVQLLQGFQPNVDAYGLATGRIGSAVALMAKDPIRALAVIEEQTTKARKHYQAMRDALVQAAAFLPAVKGKQATDRDGLPIWFRPGMEGDAGWLTTAQAESPGEDWQAVYVR
jgi:hypothetical protein